MGSGSLVPAVLNSTNLVGIGRSFLGMGQSTMRDGACQRSAQSGRSVGSLIASTALLLALSDKLFLLEIAGSSPLPCLVGAAAPRPREHPRGTGETHGVVRVERAPNGCGLASTSGCRRGGRPRDFRAR